MNRSTRAAITRCAMALLTVGALAGTAAAQAPREGHLPQFQLLDLSLAKQVACPKELVGRIVALPAPWRVTRVECGGIDSPWTFQQTLERMVAGAGWTMQIPWGPEYGADPPMYDAMAVAPGWSNIPDAFVLVAAYQLTPTITFVMLAEGPMPTQAELMRDQNLTAPFGTEGQP